jgi:mannose-1-phosphate guanylyltransferase/phosphomannomutase
VHVRDLEVSPVPLLRYKLQTFGEEGGVVFCQDHHHTLLTRIRFFDKNGLEISADREKAMERLFAREGFRRVSQEDTGYISPLPFLQGFYQEGVLKSLELETVSSAGFKVVADFCHGTTSTILPELLSELGVEVVEINPGAEGRSPMGAEEMEEWLPTLGGIVKGAGGQVGFSLSPHGESLVLVDEEGGIYRGTDLMTLVSLLLPPPGTYPWCGGTTVLLPVSAPDAVEEGLVRKGWKVHRSFHHLGRFIGEFVRVGGTLGLHGEVAPIVGVHQPVPDAVFASLWILNLMGRQEETLLRLWRSRPAFCLLEGTIHIPVEKKGILMRRLIEETEGISRSLEDGVKIFKDKGWVLAIPHQERPEFQLWSYPLHREDALLYLEELGGLLRRVMEDG